jgi:hypothetical protein
MAMVRPGCKIAELGHPASRFWPCTPQCAANRHACQSGRTRRCFDDRARATSSNLENSRSGNAAPRFSGSQAPIRGFDCERFDAGERIDAGLTAGLIRSNETATIVARFPGAIGAANPLLIWGKDARGSVPSKGSGKSAYRSKSCGHGRPERDRFASNPATRRSQLAQVLLRRRRFAGFACQGAL